MINIDILFQYLYFSARFYVPSIPNKKKIKQLMECIPFFLPTSKDQQLLFSLIKENSITNYYDTSDQMIQYGYILYETYHKRKKLSYLDMDQYIKHYDSLLFISEKKKNSKLGLILILVLILSLLYICTLNYGYYS